MNPVRTGLIVVLVGGLFSGCLVIPPGYTGYKGIDEDTIKFIQIGTTSWEEVVLRLGAPTNHDNNQFVYLIQETGWGFYAVIPAPYTAGGVIVPPRIESISLVIEFDENSIVTACRFEISEEEKSCGR